MKKYGKNTCVCLTFFTLWGFLSLRHLRMSISVVLTQPGCGRGARHLDCWSRLSLFKIHSVPAPRRPLIIFAFAPLRSLTTGRWTSQNALSWLSRIFLSALSFFLSILPSQGKRVCRHQGPDADTRAERPRSAGSNPFARGPGRPPLT